MKVHEFLTPENWCQENLAVTARGIRTHAGDPFAIRFCLLGAIFKCHDGCTCYEIVCRVEDVISVEVAKFNDTHTFEEVVALARKLDI